MKAYGYGDFDWIPHGYAGGLPEDWSPFPTVEPTYLPRPGYFPAFGPSEFGVMTVPVNFILLPENAIMQSQGIEAAWIYFFKRLDPYNDAPRQLRLERNDGTKAAVPAKVRLLARTGTRNQNEKLVDFVCVQPFFEPVASSSGSGTF